MAELNLQIRYIVIAPNVEFVIVDKKKRSTPLLYQIQY